MDTNVTNPITCFRLDLEQGELGGSWWWWSWSYTDRLHPDFRIQMRTSNSRVWISLYAADISSSLFTTDYAKKLGMTITHGSSVKDEWNAELKVYPYPHGEPHDLHVDDNNISVDFLNESIDLTLIQTKGEDIVINGTTYNTTPGNNTAPLFDLIQHYMKLPALETGDYYIDYVQYTAIAGGSQYFTYNSTEKSAYIIVDDDGEMVMIFDEIKAGGGTLTLGSDYNFMVDQSYIYNNGALILKQDDGAIFRVEPPIDIGNNTQGDLILTLKTTVLNGNYTQSGNGEGTLYTILDKTYEGSGHTDKVIIAMNNTPPVLKPIWNSYYETLNSTISDTTAHSRYYPNNMTMHIWDNSSNILVNLQKNTVAITT
ncbi:MAG: hypothetical protein K8R64_08110 [Methanosarcinaceae archaeon]|nr:hypothetical protein [Methanosarcinaceae archaeon]